jgi:hypothetical protein
MQGLSTVPVSSETRNLFSEYDTRFLFMRLIERSKLCAGVDCIGDTDCGGICGAYSEGFVSHDVTSSCLRIGCRKFTEAKKRHLAVSICQFDYDKFIIEISV